MTSKSTSGSLVATTTTGVSATNKRKSSAACDLLSTLLENSDEDVPGGNIMSAPAVSEVAK